MLRLAFDFIITWRETRTRPNAYEKIRKEQSSTLIYSFHTLEFRRSNPELCQQASLTCTRSETAVPSFFSSE